MRMRRWIGSDGLLRKLTERLNVRRKPTPVVNHDEHNNMSDGEMKADE